MILMQKTLKYMSLFEFTFFAVEEQCETQLGVRKYLFGLYSLLTVHHLLARAQANTWRQKPKQKPWKNGAYCFGPHDLFSSLSCTR